MFGWLSAAVIRRGLESARFQVDVAEDGEAGLSLALAGEYSLIILDLMLPKRDGWSVCQALRNRRITTPILMLTARDTVEDRVKGLETGADNYLPKPFDFTELIARVRALLRRDKVHKSRVIQIADLEIDTVAGSVKRGAVHRDARFGGKAGVARVAEEKIAVPPVVDLEQRFSDSLKVVGREAGPRIGEECFRRAFRVENSAFVRADDFASVGVEDIARQGVAAPVPGASSGVDGYAGHDTGKTSGSDSTERSAAV